MTSTRQRAARAFRTRGRGGSQARSVRGRRPQAARARTANAEDRRRALRRRWVAVLVVLSVLGAGYVLLFTPFLGVRTVEVIGAKRVGDERARELARIPARHPMLRVDTDGAEARIAKLPQVQRVVVSRSWPSTISIELFERAPVAYFRAYDGIRLVDRHGVPFHRVREVPAKLPELKVDKVAAADRTARAALAVLTGLPRGLSKRIKVVSADTPGSVEFTMANDKLVRWGDADQLERKAKVLKALLTRPGEIYDVSSPELPTVSD